MYVTDVLIVEVNQTAILTASPTYTGLVVAKLERVIV
jgi:hypothetical protein